MNFLKKPMILFTFYSICMLQEGNFWRASIIAKTKNFVKRNFSLAFAEKFSILSGRFKVSVLANRRTRRLATLIHPHQFNPNYRRLS
jgi:hypothetical protein